jgi:poly-gamma-glutamate capsule biosynthesis protein CapA/YwtB (metallophosphatase superfamily)
MKARTIHMSLQSNKRSQTKSSSARRKDIYKKSKYYQEKRQKLLIATGIGIFVLVFILILAGIRGCSNYMSSRQAAAKKTVSMNASKDNSQKASSDSQNTDSSNATVSSPVSLTLSVVGDCTLGTDETFDYDTSLNAYYENYGADYFLQNVKDIFSADDLTIANFEGTLTDSDEREDKTFAFKAPASYASILTGGSVEAVNTANNHSHDYGEQSFNDTLAALDDAGIVHFGYDETAVMDVKGIKVGLVGIYELYDHLEREQQLKDNIAKVKADGAQLIVVIFHWGNETETVPDSNQTTLGRIAIDEGADLVCGHHPHVLQGIETYKGRNIVYSLGNFCFGGNSSPSDMDTMIYQQTFTIDADGVKKDNVTNIIPCSISSAAYDGYNNYQPTPAEGDEATRILGKINERSSWISTAEGSTFTAKYNSNNDSQSSSADTAASDSDIVDMNSSASDDTDTETYDESYDTDNSDAE